MNVEVTKQKISQCENAINLFKNQLKQYAEERAKYQKILNAYQLRKGRWMEINADFQARAAGSNGKSWADYWRLWLSVNPEPIKPEIPPFPNIQSQIACQECVQNMNIVGVTAKRGDVDLGGQFQMLNCVQNIKANFAQQQAEKRRKEEQKRQEEIARQNEERKQKQIADLRAQQAQQEIQIRNEEESRAEERAHNIRAESAARQVEIDNKIAACNERLTELDNLSTSAINNIKAVQKIKFMNESKKMDQYMIITIFIYIFIVIVLIALSFVFSSSDNNPQRI